MDKRVEMIEQIYNENANKIYRYFYIRTNDQSLSEDLTSKTFMKMIENFDKFDEKKAKAVTWLFTIARNTLIDHLRLLSTRNTQSLQSMVSDSGDDSGQDASNGIEPELDLGGNSTMATNFGNKETEKSVKQIRNRKFLNEAIDDLSEDEQLLIHLRFTQELSYDEIAKEVGVSVNAVGVKIHRAVEKIRKVLEESGNINKIDQI